MLFRCKLRTMRRRFVLELRNDGPGMRQTIGKTPQEIITATQKAICPGGIQPKSSHATPRVNGLL